MHELDKTLHLELTVGARFLAGNLFTDKNKKIILNKYYYTFRQNFNLNSKISMSLI